jgi:hypothetical protein
VRIVENLEAARKVSHAAVMRVRRGAGKAFNLPSGHEWFELDSGKRVVHNHARGRTFT